MSAATKIFFRANLKVQISLKMNMILAQWIFFCYIILVTERLDLREHELIIIEMVFLTVWLVLLCSAKTAMYASATLDPGCSISVKGLLPTTILLYPDGCTKTENVLFLSKKQMIKWMRNIQTDSHLIERCYVELTKDQLLDKISHQFILPNARVIFFLFFKIFT